MKYKIIIISFILLIIGLYLYFLDVTPPTVILHEKIEFNQNSKIANEDIIKELYDDKVSNEDLTISYNKVISTKDTGEFYNTIIVADKKKNTTKIDFRYTVTFKDITPPKLTGIKDIKSLVNENINYLDGVSASDDYARDILIIIDDTKVDISKPGEYEVIYSVSDGVNTTIKTIKVIIVEDKKAPQIIGLRDVFLQINTEYDFNKDIKVQDDFDPNPTLEVDTSKVKYNTLGTYEVTYTSKDRAGNENKKTIKVVIGANPTNDSNYKSNKIVYLSFDDGPSNYTEELLGILKNNHVNATFFVTGKNPALYKNIINDGHAVGLHTYSHDYKIYKSEDTYFADLNKLEKTVKKEIGYSPKIMRFPGGSSNLVSKKYNKGIMTSLANKVHEKGYKYYDWNCDIGDGLSNVTKAKEISNIKACLSIETIYLLSHDTKRATIDAMQEVIPLLLQNGYYFKTIDINTKEHHHNINN